MAASPTTSSGSCGGTWPDRGLFAGYIQSQLDECNDLEETIIAVTWLLRTPD
ncbi:hypothetical protein [Alkalidesulfovibrio alkalitolerans]|uniref:hypothetical protein n=1 Tax=Alkalidesulfovibrio alkalitolerans TaxID=293256 RepID=UPI00040D4278|nr:hypothetical protein [Alkalidesulfovibrio alkalitolerans]